MDRKEVIALLQEVTREVDGLAALLGEVTGLTEEEMREVRNTVRALNIAWFGSLAAREEVTKVWARNA